MILHSNATKQAVVKNSLTRKQRNISQNAVNFRLSASMKEKDALKN